MRTVDVDRAAAILVDAAYMGDEEAATKWGISARTVKRYRDRMTESDTLSLSVREKRHIVIKDWAADLPAIILAGAEFIRRAAEEGDPTNPDMVHAVAGGMKLVAEIHFADKMLSTRLRSLDAGDSGQHRADRPQIAEMATDGEYTVGNA